MPVLRVWTLRLKHVFTATVSNDRIDPNLADTDLLENVFFLGGQCGIISSGMLNRAGKTA